MNTTSWVTAQLGIDLHVDAAGNAGLPYLSSVELGIRRNPNRAQLLVSRILGKHVPAAAADVLHAGYDLGHLVRRLCGGRGPVVVGFAETATGLGHAVAAAASWEAACVSYFHTTRRPAPAGAHVVAFLEEHSHATDQALAVADDTALTAPDVPLVLVDDEISTGKTAINAIRALHARWPRRHYVIASLLDSRTPEQHAAVTAAVEQLGASVRSVSLLTGAVDLPTDVLTRAEQVRADLPDGPTPDGPPVRVRVTPFTLPAGVPTAAAHGWTGAHERALRAAAKRAAAALPVQRDERTLVLGDEEFMYFPQLVAAAAGPRVRTSTTTRSPAAVVDMPGYPLRTALTFSSTEDPTRTAYAYNVAASAHPRPHAGNAPGFDDIVLVTDTAIGEHVTEGLVAQLAQVARRSVHVLAVHAARPDHSTAHATLKDTLC